jgi:type IX secretion system PorP/SprF family membrane protein
MGVGGYAFIDIIGATTLTTVGANYAYQLKLDQSHKMSFGINAGADVYSTSYGRLTYWDDDVMFDDQTPTTTVPRLGAGIQFYTDDYYVGVSMPRIVHFNTDGPLSIAAASMPQIVSNLYVTGGYNFPVSDDVEMQINMLGKYTRNVLPQGDLNVMATYREMVGIGVGYKSLGFLSTYIQYTHKNLVKIGYAFDFTLTPMSNYSSGSHELMFKYAIPMKVAGKSSI